MTYMREYGTVILVVVYYVDVFFYFTFSFFQWCVPVPYGNDAYIQNENIYETKKEKKLVRENCTVLYTSIFFNICTYLRMSVCV